MRTPLTVALRCVTLTGLDLQSRLGFFKSISALRGALEPMAMRLELDKDVKAALLHPMPHDFPRAFGVNA